MLDESLLQALRSDTRLPSPQGTALKIHNLLQRDNFTLPQLIVILKTDPATVGKLLKLANSASYSRARPVASLTPDVLLSLGIDAVRQLVLAFSLISGNRAGSCRPFDYERFWDRSVLWGVTLQHIAGHDRLAPAAELFTVGLLIPIGQLAMTTLFPERYAAMLEKATVPPFSSAIEAIEQADFGYSHTELSAALMKDWGIPKLFTDAVLRYHTLSLEDPIHDDRISRLTARMALASQLIEQHLAPATGAAMDIGPLLDFAQRSGLDADIKEMTGSIVTSHLEWSDLLGTTVPTTTSGINAT